VETSVFQILGEY